MNFYVLRTNTSHNSTGYPIWVYFNENDSMKPTDHPTTAALEDNVVHFNTHTEALETLPCLGNKYVWQIAHINITIS